MVAGSVKRRQEKRGLARKRRAYEISDKTDNLLCNLALVLSLILGIALYRISLGYETKRQEENIAMTSAQLVSQMDERLRRMDAIMYYILSDPDVLFRHYDSGKKRR